MKTNYITYMERLDYLLELITKNRISTPKEIANRFDCCEKTARNMINNLRELGYDIKYCKSTKNIIIKPLNGNYFTV